MSFSISQEMMPAKQAVPFKARLTAAAASIVVYIVACCMPALDLVGKEHTHIYGWMAFLYGPLVLFTGQFSWLANPLWFAAILFMLFGGFRTGLIISLLAVLVATHAWALFGTEIPGDEGGGTTYTLKALEIGFYLWLLSLALLPPAAAFLLKKARALQSSAANA